ncbi:hypothetical protein DPMN_175730 [Dreissena polymorpha]|uniref:Uncharacterized protein n=1 Tax=Dreissena polymorpha TaxID=45954 RepID=A0A9D4IHI0_DREPO|nr:hypothetical protein DPMN_175730 [Dreissena polymorpha]
MSHASSVAPYQHVRSVVSVFGGDERSHSGDRARALPDARQTPYPLQYGDQVFSSYAVCNTHKVMCLSNGQECP